MQLDGVLYTVTAALQNTVDEETRMAGLQPDTVRERAAADATGKLGACLRAALSPTMQLLGHEL